MSYDTYSGKDKEERMRELGIFTNDREDSFKSDQEVRRKLALEGQLPEPQFKTPLPVPRPFDYWSQRFRTRQEQYQETASQKKFVDISFPGDITLNFIGDTHAGNPETHYKRLEQEVETIVNSPQSYIILVGDLVDGFFFNPAQMEEMEQVPEQFQYVNSLLKYIGEKKRLLFGFSGQHDSWVRKMGADPEAQFAQELGSFYFQGVGHIQATCGEVPYKLVGAHNLPGFSIRDNTWSQKRASAEIQGADIYFAGDSHKKGHSEQPIKEFGPDARWVHYISIGPYKPSDEYSRKLGYADQTPNEMYGSAVKLSGDHFEIKYFDNILEANK